MFISKVPVFRSRKSNKCRQYNELKKKYNNKNNGLQNSTQKTKDWATRTTQKSKTSERKICFEMIMSL